MHIKLDHLTLADMKLALRDLLTRREPALLGCRAGMLHILELQELRAAVDKLPEELTASAPTAAKLHRIGAEHHGFGAALHHILEGYRRMPSASEETRRTAERLRDAFVPELDELDADHGTQFRRAQSRRPKLEELQTELRSFPVFPRGTTLFDVAARFVESGLSLGENVSRRRALGETEPSSNAELLELRSRAVHVLNRLRAEIARDVARDRKLPADLELRLLGYFDLLDEQRREARAALLRQR